MAKMDGKVPARCYEFGQHVIKKKKHCLRYFGNKKDGCRNN